MGPTVTLDTNGCDSSAMQYIDVLGTVGVTGFSDAFQTNGEKLQEHLERVYCL